MTKKGGSELLGELGYFLGWFLAPKILQEIKNFSSELEALRRSGTSLKGEEIESMVVLILILNNALESLGSVKASLMALLPDSK